MDEQKQNDLEQRNLLEQYVMAIAKQNAHFEFSGGSTLKGADLPGWDTLKLAWPRRILLGTRKSLVSSPFWVELSYSSPNRAMVSAMYKWLNAQFTCYSIGVKAVQPSEMPVVKNTTEIIVTLWQ